MKSLPCATPRSRAHRVAFPPSAVGRQRKSMASIAAPTSSKPVAVNMVMERLIAQYPVEVKKIPGKGRGLVATRSLRKGEFVLASAAAAVSLHRKHQRLCCIACCAYSEDSDISAPVVCSSCNTTYYCSEQCREKDAELHEPHCSLLCEIDSSASLKREEASLVRLLLRMLSTCARTKLRNDLADTLANTEKPILGGQGAASEGATEVSDNGRLSPPECSLADVMDMMPDSKSISGFLRRRKQRLAAARFFVDLVKSPLASATNLLDQLVICPEFGNVKILCELLARGPPNEFALFDIHGEGCGCGVFPSAALINHSCVPSCGVQLEGSTMCFYTTRDVSAGEELTQSYANLGGDGRMDRKENLLISWGFDCHCMRCSLKSGERRQEIDTFDAANVCSCGGVMVPLERRGSRKNHEGEFASGKEGECHCNSFNLRIHG